MANTPAPHDPTAHKGHPSQEWSNYPKSKVALPTIGRVVHYYHPDFKQPLAAMVADVIGSYTTNLGVLRPDGSGFAMRGVPHISEALEGQAHWDWMDYQKGQAAKTEQLQRELDAKTKATGGPEGIASGTNTGVALGDGIATAGGQGSAGAMQGSK